MGETNLITAGVGSVRLPFGNGELANGVEAAELCELLNLLSGYGRAGDAVAAELAKPGINKIRFYGMVEAGGRVLAYVNRRGVWVCHGPLIPGGITWEWYITSYGQHPAAVSPFCPALVVAEDEDAERWDGMS